MSDREDFEKAFGEMMDLSPAEMVWQPERRCYQELAVHWAWKAWQLAARSTPMAGAEPHKQGEAVCEVCGGAGEVFEHADSCDDDLCALNGDQHSCVGRIVRCTCVPSAAADFECEDCIGMREHGCYCKAMGATQPGGPAPSVEPAQCVAEDDADEIMHKVGELVGMSHGAWDMVSARGLVAAFKKVLAPAPHQEPGWQPIETAPKDGRELILLLTPSRFPQVAYSNTWWTSGFSVECKPTHWMPLPAAPKEGRS